MRRGEPTTAISVQPPSARSARLRLGRALTACVMLGAAFVGCAAGPEWTSVRAGEASPSSRPLDADPASAEALGRDAMETLGYARILDLARQAGFVTTKKAPRRPGAEGALLATGGAAAAAGEAAGAGEVLSEYAVAAGVASQLDSPLPGPGDLVALGILVIGIVHAGVLTAEDLAKGHPPVATTAPPPSPPSPTAIATSTASPAPTVTAPPIPAPLTCGSVYPQFRECGSLPGEYRFQNEQEALALMKARLGQKNLSLHRPDRTQFGPCPGAGEHFNVRQGGKRAGSITCCPCCVEGPPLPQAIKRCRIVP